MMSPWFSGLTGAFQALAADIRWRGLRGAARSQSPTH